MWWLVTVSLGFIAVLFVVARQLMNVKGVRVNVQKLKQEKHTRSIFALVQKDLVPFEHFEHEYGPLVKLVRSLFFFFFFFFFFSFFFVLFSRSKC